MVAFQGIHVGRTRFKERALGIEYIEIIEFALAVSPLGFLVDVGRLGQNIAFEEPDLTLCHRRFFMCPLKLSDSGYGGRPALIRGFRYFEFGGGNTALVAVEKGEGQRYPQNHTVVAPRVKTRRRPR